MKEDNGQRLRKMMKGFASAAMIAGCFFLLKQRLPQLSDMTGMTALTAVCVAASLSGQSGGAATEEFHGGDMV